MDLRKLLSPAPTLVLLLLLGLTACIFFLWPGSSAPSLSASAGQAVRSQAENPLYGAWPSSTLLKPGTTQIALTVLSSEATKCRYSVGKVLAYSQMKPFRKGQGTKTHRTLVGGLSANPSRVNDVYVRCASQPEFLLHLQYRSLARMKPRFPRTGNLWGSRNFVSKGMAYCARIDLWLGAFDFSAAQIVELRSLNPNILILTSINAIENQGLPDDYYLKDVNGNKIEVYPGSYRLNMTKPYVADYQARYAYQAVLNTGLTVDGCFFDNFQTVQSGLKTDIWGNPVKIDANEDGIQDDPAWLDAAWRQGVFREMQTFRTLMPYAFADGHLPWASDSGVAQLFNGNNVRYTMVDVLDGRRPFADAWKDYQDWCKLSLKPGITMVESTPQNQISSGYGYDPLNVIPPETLEFARTYFPYMRFGLALTLMNDGYFAHEFGDAAHGGDWWYDELNFDLGYPSGPAKKVTIPDPLPDPNLLANGTFEAPLEGSWDFWVDNGSGCQATADRDSASKPQGSSSALITVTNIGEGVDWHISLSQGQRSVAGGQDYDLTFWAKADSAGRVVTVCAQKGSSDWRNYGLNEHVTLSATWEKYTVTFQATETATDARVFFYVGNQLGKIWLDDVRITRHPPDVYRRDFTNGIVLLNGTRKRITVPLGKTFYHLKGDQAPGHQYILDDAPDYFAATGNWETVTIDSGEGNASGPFYHDWGPGCHRLAAGQQGHAEWGLSLREDDTYTIQAWWPAGPDSSGRSHQVIYEIMEGASVIGSITLDQTTGGDEWHTIATLPLFTSTSPRIRVRNGGSGAVIADALHVLSAKRLNDGKALSAAGLEPLDGVILRRTNPNK